MAHSVHASLAGHATNPPRFHQHIDVTLTHAADGGLAISYAIHGLNMDLHVPTPHAPAPADALWRTTCCELFLSPLGQAGYREFNFSPSGQWAHYDFLDFRQHAPATASTPAPRIDVKREENLLQLDVALTRSALPTGDTLRIALAVVLESNDSKHGYWALAHPSGQPDFHHHAGFVLTLGAMGFRPARWP